MDKVERFGRNRGLVKPNVSPFVSTLFTVSEEGLNGVRIVTFTAKPTTTLTLTDDAGVGQWGTLKLCDMPAFAGKLQAYVDIGLILPAPFIDAPVVTAALGTTAAASGIALATTKVDVAAAHVVPVVAAKTVEGQWVDVAGFNMAAASLAVHLNLQVADNVAHATAAAIPIAGLTVKLLFAMYG